MIEPRHRGWAWCWCAAFGWPVDEPEKPTVETSSAATKSAIVTTRILAGVSQVRWWAANQLRAPVAPAAAAMAQAAHMRDRLARECRCHRRPFRMRP